MESRQIRRGALERSQVRVGLALGLGLLLLGYGVVRVGELFDVFADRYPLITLVPTAAGLLEGAPVTLAGQRVGQVKRIDFIPIEHQADEEHIRIVLSINEDVREQIRGDSEAQIQTQGLLGDKFIDIAPGSPRYPTLQAGDTLPSKTAVDLAVVLAKAAETLSQAQLTIRDLDRITGRLARGEGTLGRLLTDEALYAQMVHATTTLAATLREINAADGTLGRLIHDPALYHELHGAIARVDSLGGTILHGTGTLGQLVQNDSLYRGLLGTVTRADSAVAGIAGLLDQAGNKKGTLQRMLTDPAMYDQFLKAVVDLQTLLADIRANPLRYRPEVNIEVF